jgi:hypothetical protein
MLRMVNNGMLVQNCITTSGLVQSMILVNQLCISIDDSAAYLRFTVRHANNTIYQGTIAIA